jgi:hypothetical protein
MTMISLLVKMLGINLQVLLGVKLEKKYQLLVQIGGLLMVKRSMSCGLM